MIRIFGIFICFFLFQSVQGAECRILSLDGGGVRGVVSLEILRHLQESTALNLHEDFDLYCGTSTGAIIAVALACKMPVEEILAAYKELSSYVFGHANYLYPLNPRYDNKRLKKAIQKLLKRCNLSEDLLIKDLPKKVVLTTVSLKTNSRSHRWEMEFIQNMTPSGGRVSVIDALLQATAAPTYFTAACNHVDGGMGMNDPSLAGLMFAYGPESSLRDFILLSIGTGYFPHFVEHGEDWGALKWSLIGSRESGWFPFLNLLMDLQEDIPKQVLKKLLANRYRKIDIILSKNVQLEDAQEIPYLIQYTKDSIGSNPQDWQDTQNWVSEVFKREGWWQWVTRPLFTQKSR